ncbi:MAG: TetR/AcrR family transcriptional regulator [Eubacteriaceae bacterium]|jgi:AcrR family transcriptional regulator
MKRVQNPEIRKQQILETAMDLFYKNGYENTSLADIADELHVVKGLCYRYFDSKQSLFNAVLTAYTEDCGSQLTKSVHDRSIPLMERLTGILLLLIEPEARGKYHDFFHKTGNEDIHEQLAVRICKYLIPHIREELEEYDRMNPASGCISDCSPDPESTARFITWGMIGIWMAADGQTQDKLNQFEMLTSRLLERKPVTND